MAIVAAEDFHDRHSDGEDWAPALMRAQRAIGDGGEITLFQRPEYTFLSKLAIIRRVAIRGADVGLSTKAGTILRFIRCPGVHIIFPGNPDYPDEAGGFCMLERLVLMYGGGKPTDNVDHHGILVQRACSLSHVSVFSFPGDGVRVDAGVKRQLLGDDEMANLVDGVDRNLPSGANINAFYRVRSYGNGRCGFYFFGNDSNSSTVIACDATYNGRRKLPDANHGFYDSSFFGNYFFGCHTSTNTGRGYKSVKDSVGSVVIACYSEGGQVNEITYPSIAISGTLQAADDVSEDGKSRIPGGLLQGILRYKPMNLSDFQVDSLGRLETKIIDGKVVEEEVTERVVGRFARKGINQLMNFTSKNDKQGYHFETVVDKSVASNTWSWLHAGASEYSTFGFTQPKHDRNRGHAIAYRGVITGKAQVRLGSGAKPPTRSEEEDVWKVGDRWFVPPPPASREPLEYVCTQAPEPKESSLLS